eukprot:jgi/Orpsp1_1/1191560/evm.model.d7180000087004.1
MKLNTNVVAREDDIIISGEWGKLYQCVSGECTYNEIPNDNYYLKTDNEGKYVELTYCENRECKSINSGKTYTINSESKVGLTEGFRLGNSRQYPLIQCVAYEKKNEEDENNPYSITSIPVCKEREFKEGWFLNADSEENEVGLIRCTKEFGCEKYEGFEEGWYINGAVNFNIKKEKLTENDVLPLIKCESNSCALHTEALPTSCSKAGEVISSSGYKLCIDKKNSVALTSSSINVINSEVALPGAAIGYVVVKVGDNRAIIAEDGNYAQGSNPTTMYE